MVEGHDKAEWRMKKIRREESEETEGKCCFGSLDFKRCVKIYLDL